MMEDLFLIIANIAPGVSAIAVIIWLIDFKAKQPVSRLLGLLSFLYAFTHILSLIVINAKGGGAQNYIYSASNIIELALILTIFYRTIDGLNRGVLGFAFLSFLTFAVTNMFFIQGKKINSYSLIFMSIIVLLYSVYYFYWLIQKLPTSQLQRLPLFWVTSAWLIFYSGTLFLFTFIDYVLITQQERILQYWTLHNILKIIESTMIAVALWIDLQNTRSRSSLA
jgi:hypothetical protein